MTSDSGEYTTYVYLPDSVLQLIVSNPVLFIKPIGYFPAVNNILLHISYANAEISTHLIQAFHHYIITTTLE